MCGTLIDNWMLDCLRGERRFQRSATFW